MAITQAVCLSYKEDLFNGVHETADTYKIALYTSSATLDKNTTAYTATNEVANGNGYTTGGATLGSRTVGSSSDVRYLMWADPQWTTSTITARGALIYNSSQSNAALCVIDFGSDISSTAGTFTVDFPAAGASALLRIP